MSIIKDAVKKVQEIIGENKPTQDDYIAQAAQKYASQKDKAIADNTSEYAKTAETIKSLYQGSIEEAETKYDDLSRQNEVQKYINAREVAENNANLGLTDSGLNRTQQTAVQLSASNNEAKIQRARQSGVDALVREMTVDLSENETNRANSEKAIRQYYEGLASSEGTAAYKADVEAETARIKAQQDAKNEKNAAYTSLLNQIQTGEIVNALPSIYNFVANYDYVEGESEVELAVLTKTLLDAADIEKEEFIEYSNKINNVTEDSTPKYVPLKDRDWKVFVQNGERYNGGVNGFLGLGKWFGNIDDNAVVVDKDGNRFSMAELSAALQKEGMDQKEAKKFLVYLQEKLDI